MKLFIRIWLVAITLASQVTTASAGPIDWAKEKLGKAGDKAKEKALEKTFEPIINFFTEVFAPGAPWVVSYLSLWIGMILIAEFFVQLPQSWQNWQKKLVIWVLLFIPARLLALVLGATEASALGYTSVIIPIGLGAYLYLKQGSLPRLNKASNKFGGKSKCPRCQKPMGPNFCPYCGHRKPKQKTTSLDL